MPNFSGVWDLKDQVQAIAAGRWTGLPVPLIYSWGSNGGGQIGDGTVVSRSSPVQIGSNADWDEISAGSGFSFGIRQNALYFWGGGLRGRSGLNINPVYRSSPTQIGTLQNWSKISAGTQLGLSVKTDGTLWSWGRNDAGELGTNDRVYRSSPTQIGALTTWSQPSGGLFFSGAVKNDNTLWMWGYNDEGQLGQNNRINRSSPVQVGGLANWAQLTTSSNSSVFALAIKTDGTLWAWGSNARGQLGLSDLIRRSSPVQVGALSTWSKVSATGSFTIATTSAGGLYAWGDNGDGQLGLGNIISYVSSPVQVGSLTNWSKPSAGSASSFAVKSDGTIWGWGYNAGRLGLNDAAKRSSPVQIGSQTRWADVDAGVDHTLAIYQGSSN